MKPCLVLLEHWVVISAIHINPAASAVFNTSEFGLSVSSLTTEKRLHILAIPQHKIKAAE